MSLHSSTSPDIIPSLTATAYAPVLIEACAGRDDTATKPCHARPTLLMPSIALGMASLDAQAAESFRKPTGEQIAGVLAGMQFADEAHWREVYESNGALRNYAKGREHAGKWHVENGRLCLAFASESAGDCFDVWRNGNTLEMRRDAEDRHPIVGIVEKPTDPPTTAMKE
jgi:hypothetical protein